MLAEAREAPAVAATVLQAEAAALQALGRHLRDQPPQALLTVARGSSDHAAHYLAYLVMARLGRVVASLPMSLVTLYRAQLAADGLAAFALSQSGQSPDLVDTLAELGRRGACTVALVNQPASPLAGVARHVISLHAGKEHSVAATKSCLAQLVASAALVNAWQPEPAFAAALQTLPEAMTEAVHIDDHAAAGVAALNAALVDAERLYVIGRGTGLPVAMEVALKLKEVCGLQAEAFSGAELLHGPMALVEPGFTLLLLAPEGPAQPGLLALADDMRRRGARVLLAAPPGTAGVQLPLVATRHADLAPVLALQRLYPAIEALARARGLNPDRPRHLSKVTRTL